MAAAPARYADLLAGRDGMIPAADGGWNATAYVWHLVDLARSWTERWAQIDATPGSRLVGWDPDVLADARGYRQLPTPAAVWALPDAVDAFVAATRRVGMTTPFEHADWGSGTVADAVVWLGHEFTHHQLDVAERVAAPCPREHATSSPGVTMPILRQVAQHADDLDRAVGFYRDVVGLRPIAVYDPPGLAFFDMSGTRLLLDRAAPSALLYFWTDDVPARTEALRAAGVEIVSEPHVIFGDDDGTFGPPGEAEVMAFFRDSEGNLVALAGRQRS